MSEHTIGPGYVVREIDFANGMLLVAEHEITAGVVFKTAYRHVRYWWDADHGRWHKDIPRARDSQHLTLESKSHCWVQTEAPRRVTISWARQHVTVDRRDLRRAVGHVVKLSGRGLGTEGLLTVHLYRDGVTLLSHAPIAARITLDSTTSARDGLGTLVVLARQFEALLKDLSPNEIELHRDPHDRALVVHGKSLWSADVRPHTTAPASASLLPRLVGRALTRALPFVSADSARPSLYSAVVAGKGDHVLVQATDGHRAVQIRLGREAFSTIDLGRARAFGERTVYVPQPVLAIAAKDRTYGTSVSWTDADAIVTIGPLAVTCPQPELTMPAIGQVLDHAGYAELALPTAVWTSWRAWLRAQKKVLGVVRLRFGQTKGPAVGMIHKDSPQLVFSARGHDETALLALDEESCDPWCSETGVYGPYVLDALELFDEDADTDLTVFFSLPPYRPIHLTDGTTHVVIMPRSR